MSLRNCAAVSPSHSNGPSERPSRLIWLWRHGPMTRKLFPILPFAFSASQLVIAPYMRSEEHTSELQSLMRISYAVFCLKKKTTTQLIQPVNILHTITTHYHRLN